MKSLLQISSQRKEREMQPKNLTNGEVRRRFLVMLAIVVIPLLVLVWCAKVIFTSKWTWILLLIAALGVALWFLLSKKENSDKKTMSAKVVVATIWSNIRSLLWIPLMIIAICAVIYLYHAYKNDHWGSQPHKFAKTFSKPNYPSITVGETNDLQAGHYYRLTCYANNHYYFSSGDDAVVKIMCENDTTQYVKGIAGVNDFTIMEGAQMKFFGDYVVRCDKDESIVVQALPN